MSEEFLVFDTEADTKPIREEKLHPLPILKDSHPILRKKIEEFDVTNITQPEIQKFIKNLKITKDAYGGLGLSANQVGISFRMFVMGHGETTFVCINPKITEKSEETERLDEGCLSSPGLKLMVERHKKITVEYFNEEAQKVQTQFEGLTAQVYQHELDHLDGIEYTDRVKPLALKMAREKQAKLIKKITRARK